MFRQGLHAYRGHTHTYKVSAYASYLALQAGVSQVMLRLCGRRAKDGKPEQASVQQAGVQAVTAA